MYHCLTRLADDALDARRQGSGIGLRLPHVLLEQVEQCFDFAGGGGEGGGGQRGVEKGTKTRQRRFGLDAQVAKRHRPIRKHPGLDRAAQ